VNLADVLCSFIACNFSCRLAVKELLLEAAHNKQKAVEMGAAGWYV